MYGTLVPVGGGDPIDLRKHRLKIGRRETCDIVLRFPNVSAHHCELSLFSGYWFVKDLESQNGVKVNGVKVTEKRVDPGDTLSVGKHAYRLEYNPEDLGAVGVPPSDATNVAGILSTPLLQRAGLTHERKTQSRSRPKPSKPAQPAPEPETENDESEPV